jgi:hypothetical protein
VIQAVFGYWLVAGVASNSGSMTGTGPAVQGAQAGTMIGAGLILGLWIGVDLLLVVARRVVLAVRRNKNRSSSSTRA